MAGQHSVLLRCASSLFEGENKFSLFCKKTEYLLSQSARLTAHLRENKASQDEVRRGPALYVHGYEPVWRAQADSQLPLHALLQHPHLRLQGSQSSTLLRMCFSKAVNRAACASSMHIHEFNSS